MAIVIGAVSIAHLVWLGLVQDGAAAARGPGHIAFDYVLISFLLCLSWIGALSVFGTRDARVLGVGSGEYKRVLDATGLLFSVVAITAYLTQIDIARGYLLIALPFGLGALLGSRWGWRQWLHRQRRGGQFSSQVLLFGSLETVTVTARELLRAPESGYKVLAASVIEHGNIPPRRLVGTDLPIISTERDVLDVMDEFGCDTLVVTGSDALPADRIREISWRLEPGRHHLVMAPSLTDVGGPRIHTRPVAGLPLVHVETPRFEGINSTTKRAFDVAVSTAALILTAPLLLGLAVAVRLSGAGPVLYRSERIGHRGEPFDMLKFRSMRVGADRELAELLSEQGTAGKPLFKVKNDPRITPLGRILRKYSLDELPQLINVLRGDMSLVGPRPQVAAEVALYDDAAARRLLLKPGVSGLWQVSGRSSLSWEDAIRLDLYYVENWSLMGDLVILWRTFRAVIDPGQTAH